MKVLLFFLLLGAYLFMGLLGLKPKGYIDRGGIDMYFDTHRSNLLIYGITITLSLTFLYWNAFRSVIRKKKELIVTTLIFSVGFFYFAFMYRKTQLSFFNNSGYSSTVDIQGTVTNTYTTWNSKHTKRTYFINIHDSSFGRKHTFEVSDYIYHRTKKGDAFNKTFFAGRLGVLYRKEAE
jgi:hypothetical protein